MKLITEVENKKFVPGICYGDLLLFIGSCFAENISGKFIENKFNAYSNPMGVVYNPISVLNCIEIIVDKKIFDEKDLFLQNEMWHSYFHHSRFSSSSTVDTLDLINKEIEIWHNHIRSAKYLFVTLGTAWVYELKANNKVVSNCHKSPSNSFNHKLLSVDEVFVALKNIVEKVRTVNNNVNVVFTVSPIRHLRDGAHQNQISKSTLILGVEKLMQNDNNLQYFPAYEIMLDELRDYRFYEDNLTHPSKLAINIIWEKIQAGFLDVQTNNLMQKVIEICQASQHRPQNTNSKDYLKFVENTIGKITEIEKQGVPVNFTKELILLKKHLK